MKIRRFISITLVLISILCIPAQAFAGYIWGNYSGRWEFVSSTQTPDTNKGYGWSHCYTSYPATRTGETVTISDGIGVSASISGTINIPLTKIKAEIGFPSLEFGANATLSVSVTSAQLNKGEYVKAYIRPLFNRWSIKQQGTRTGRAYDTDETGYPISGEYIKTISLGYEYCYVYRPLLAQLKLEYYSSSTANSNGYNTYSVNDELVRTEIYSCIDGQCTLVSVE